MTKAELIAEIKNKVDSRDNLKKNEISLKLISAVIENFFDIMKNRIAEGEHIELRGFGTFETKIREPKKALNPRTKEVVHVKRHAVPIFRPGKDLKKLTRDYFDKNNK